MAENPAAAAAAAVNHGEGLRLPETSSRCVTERAAHNFEVTYCALLEGMGVGKYISSSTFRVGGYDWNIRFYPDGDRDREDLTGNASAFLAYLSQAKDEVRTKFTLSMLDDHGNAQERHKDYVAEHIFTQQADRYGIPKFVEKSKLKPSSHLLTIRCDLTVIKEPPADCQRNPIVVPPSELPDRLERALKDGKGTDVTLLVGGREFIAHRFMLAVQSPVFYAQLFGPMTDKEDTRCIEVVDMEPVIFEMLLNYVYKDSLPPCGEKGYDAATMQHLLVAADRYGLDRLKVMCEEKLFESINVQTVTSTLAVADRHFCKQLKHACEKFLSTPGIAAVVLLRNGVTRLMAKLRLGDKEDDEVI